MVVQPCTVAERTGKKRGKNFCVMEASWACARGNQRPCLSPEGKEGTEVGTEVGTPAVAGRTSCVAECREVLGIGFDRTAVN